MKRLDFSRIKKSVSIFVNFFAKMFKKKYSEAKIKTEENKAPSGSYDLRRGGYKYYTHILKDVRNNRPDIYRSFKKQKLIGSLMFIGKTLYKIETNPYFGK
jgi:hypothetical protein